MLCKIINILGKTSSILLSIVLIFTLIFSISFNWKTLLHETYDLLSFFFILIVLYSSLRNIFKVSIIFYLFEMLPFIFLYIFNSYVSFATQEVQCDELSNKCLTETLNAITKPSAPLDFIKTETIAIFIIILLLFSFYFIRYKCCKLQKV